MTLLEAVFKLPADTLLCIGSASGFVWVIDRVEFNYIVPSYWKMREVKSIYSRITGGHVIVVEGDEAGKSWTREEFNENYEEFKKSGNSNFLYTTSSRRVRCNG